MSIKIRGEEYYLVADLVDILPLKVNTIRMYMRQGIIRGKKIGVLWYVSNSDLKRFLDSGSRDYDNYLKKRRQS